MSPTSRARRRGHLLDADHQREPAAPGGEEIARAMHRGRTGGAGVLVPRDRPEAQFRHVLQHQRGGKVLLGEPVVEQADEARLDIGRRDAGIVDRGAGNAADQRLDIGIFQLAERRMRPADDAGFGHGFGLLIWWRETSGLRRGWRPEPMSAAGSGFSQQLRNALDKQCCGFDH